MKPPKVDDLVFYWSEPRGRGGPPGGPFPARVVKVVDKEGIADLSVEVASGTFRPKTGVPSAESPTKHHWTWPARAQ